MTPVGTVQMFRCLIVSKAGLKSMKQLWTVLPCLDNVFFAISLNINICWTVLLSLQNPACSSERQDSARHVVSDFAWGGANALPKHNRIS